MDSEPTVTISNGQLRGKTGTSINRKCFYSFQGIPYAKPPIGVLRFKAPLPPESWKGIRDATHEGDECFQKKPFIRQLQGSEDCLTLNVYTPDLPKEKNSKKPVMVWIHGGGFTSGSGNTELYGPEFLLSEEIVLVTINYRVGVLGFLSLEDLELDVPGNAGLKDMVMALKWVQKNITHFNGDSNNVTIFGESAGGAAVHYLILSPMAKGLFHKAIMQSGCALNVWAKGQRSVTDLARNLNLETTDERKMLKVLQDLPIEELYKAVEKIPDNLIASIIRPFGPVIERKSSGAFLSEEPSTIIKSGAYNHVPIIIGYTTREGMLSEIYQKPKPYKPVTDFELCIPHFMKLQLGSNISKMVAKQIKEFYFGDKEPSTENVDKFYILDTDNFFLRELLLTARLHVETSSKPVYFYCMSVETRLNFLKKMFGITAPGVCHGDDLGYLFKNILIDDEIEPGSEEEVAVTRFITLWTNFAKRSDPNPKNTNPLINVYWEPVTKNKIHFLDIGKELTMKTSPEPERMAFWHNIVQNNPVHKL